MIPLLGFTPDADSTLAGVITDCTNTIPSDRGMEGAPSQAAAVSGLAALAAECRGAAVLTSTTGISRTFAGTQTKIYELTGATWADVSRTLNYTGSTENRVMFAQFGNAALATNDTEVIGATTSGIFVDIATAPKARIIVAAQNFVIAFNTVDATYGDSPDRWWCCAFQDHSLWTPSLTTQATTGRLVGEAGEITAAARLGQYVIAYKTKALFLGSYVGSPAVWQWDQIPGDVGCIGPEAVADIGGAHIFIGDDNIWQFDGTRPIPIAGGQVRQWFFNNSSATYRYRSIVKFDRQNNRVWIHFPSAASTGQCDRVLVYHLVTRQWGRADQSVEAVINFVTPGLTWDTLSSVAASWDALPNLPWDSQAWQASGKTLAVFNTSHSLQSLTGASTGGSITTGDVGDDAAVSYANGAKLRFLRTPTAGTVSGSTKQALGDTLVVSSSGVYADGKFDVRQSGRWHRFAFTLTGPFEALGFDVSLRQAGQR